MRIEAVSPLISWCVPVGIKAFAERALNAQDHADKSHGLSLGATCQ